MFACFKRTLLIIIIASYVNISKAGAVIFKINYSKNGEGKAKPMCILRVWSTGHVTNEGEERRWNNGFDV